MKPVTYAKIVKTIKIIFAVMAIIVLAIVVWFTGEYFTRVGRVVSAIKDADECRIIYMRWKYAELSPQAQKDLVESNFFAPNTDQEWYFKEEYVVNDRNALNLIADEIEKSGKPRGVLWTRELAMYLQKIEFYSKNQRILRIEYAQSIPEIFVSFGDWSGPDMIMLNEPGILDKIAAEISKDVKIKKKTTKTLTIYTTTYE